MAFLGFAAPVLAQAPGARVLVFSKTAGFRHSSIADGIAAVEALGSANGFAVDATEDAAQLNDANLAQYDAVIFLNTTGDILDASQESAFERYIQGGRGFVGIHSAADTEYEWAWYGGLVGAYFQSHPAIQAGTVVVADLVHPSTAGLPRRWARTDEWYNFQANPRGELHVLATLDETTYSGGTMGHDHPIAWCHSYNGGRAFYTAGGHTSASYSEPLFLEHLLGGIRFAAGWVTADCVATVDRSFEKVVLDANVNQPMELAVAGDGRVFFVERGGALKIYKPSTSSTLTAGTLAVTTVNEDGLLGVTLDPDFAANGWIYLFYSPAGPLAMQCVSRFEMSGDTLVLGSEEVLLEIPTQRDQCCHSAGSLAFGPTGDLFISTGDNSNPFASDGRSPIDERAGRSPWDAQKSSANRNDLRGKVLRITPLAGGGYVIPPGNLFPPDGSAGRPEIYTMGSRNPFRISVDQETSWLYWGDVGPDAAAFDPARGPAGYDELNQARSAGNYGWPYCIGDNEPYIDFDFETGVSGAAFDCSAPVNLSPNNTGGTELPPARPAWIWYPYASSSEFPEVNGGSGRSACAGPVYHFSEAVTNESKLPAYYDNTLFIYEWSRMWIKEVKLDENGDILKISPFLQSFTFLRPIDLEIGPDGALYLLEWGVSFFGGVDGAKLSRIDYLGTRGRSPIAVASAAPTAGSTPLSVEFSSAGSHDPDGGGLSFAWSFFDDGSTNSTAPNPSFIYSTAGNYTARLTVEDMTGATGTATIPIAAGNNRATVTIIEPANGTFFAWGDTISFEVQVVDVEDGSTLGAQRIPCSSLEVQPFLGHDDHGHPQGLYHACRGQHVTDLDHSDVENTYLVLEARYTDQGAPGVDPLQGKATHLLQPRRKQAEHFSTQSGVLLEATGDTLGGGRNIGFIDHGDHISFRPMNLKDIGSLTFRTASAGLGGRIEVRVDSPAGALVSTAQVSPTGGWQTYTDVTASVQDPGGTHELFFVFLRNPGDRDLFNVNWIDFNESSSLPGDCNQDGVVDAADGSCFSEPFEYSPAGADLLSQNGGSGFSGPWFASGFNASIHDNYDVTQDSLSFGALAVSGNRVRSGATNAIAGIGRNLAVPISGGATTTVYFSLLLRPEGTLGAGVFNGFFGAYLDGTGNADLFVGKPGSAAAGRYVLENRGGSGQVQSATTPVVGQSVLLVVRADLRPGADVFTLHVDPDPCEPEPAAGTVKSDLDLGDVTAVVIYSSGAFSLDELRMGSSFENVLEWGGAACVEPGLQKPSDCNQDGVLDISDGLCLLFALFLDSPLPCGERTTTDPANVTLLDLGSDGRLDLTDAIALFSYVFGSGPPHPLGVECQDIPGCASQCME
jgi:glucose/arabinose dehydrogenase